MPQYLYQIPLNTLLPVILYNIVLHPLYMPQLCILKMPRYLTGYFRYLAIWGDCSGLLLRVIHKYWQCMKWNGLVNVWKANADEIKIKYLHRMIV